MKKLFTCYYGSKLYGTNTPSSDTDIKHIVLPSLDDMLLGRKLVAKVKKTNQVKDTRNSADDVDEEFIPLQVFATDFFNGQTYALELAFAVEGNHAGQTFYGEYNDNPCLWGDMRGVVPFMKFVRDMRSTYLTSNIKAMMGYVVNQASLYSFKGERLNATREVKAAYGRAEARNLSELRVGDLIVSDEMFDRDMLELELKYPKYVQRTKYDIGTGVMKPCFVLLQKTLPFTDRIEHSLEVISNLEGKYGSRSDAATADNVDWKATMHALRIVDEGLALLLHKQLTFPFNAEYRDRLLSIKRGEVDIDLIKDELDRKLTQLKEVEQTTTLPAGTPELKASFDLWLVTQLRNEFYKV